MMHELVEALKPFVPTGYVITESFIEPYESQMTGKTYVNAHIVASRPDRFVYGCADSDQPMDKIIAKIVSDWTLALAGGKPC